MAFYVWYRQAGEGCGYMVGCGEKLKKLKALHPEAALAEAHKLIRGGKDGEDGIAIESEGDVTTVLVLELVADVSNVLDEVRTELIRDSFAKSNETKKKQLEALKKELGED